MKERETLEILVAISSFLGPFLGAMNMFQMLIGTGGKEDASCTTSQDCYIFYASPIKS